MMGSSAYLDFDQHCKIYTELKAGVDIKQEEQVCCRSRALVVKVKVQDEVPIRV